MNKCVKISIEKFDEFDMQMAEKIACFVWNRPDWDEHLIKCFEMFKEDSECFNLIAFANKTDVGGLWNGQWIMGNDSFVTVVYGKKTTKVLPRTGY